MEVEKQIKSLLSVLSEGIYEKEHILSMALLSAVAGESIFLLGPPGTAKSLVARRLKMAFKYGLAFEYLMSRFSTPDEIFGPVSISKLKNEDRYERVVDGFLPTATVVFLDEIWKAGPSIQNALLTAINEKIFQNGRTTLSLPLKALIAASNELPAEDEGLEALWDRFLVRMVSNCIQSESTFYKMIRQKPVDNISVPDEIQITEELYNSWNKEIQKVTIPDDICKKVTHIRKQLKDEGTKEDHHEMDYYVSDRRWKKCFHLMQASAFLNGRKNVDITDLPLLFHCLWNTSDSIPAVIDSVASSLTADIDKRCIQLAAAIDLALKNKSNIKQGKNTRWVDTEEFLTVNFFFFKIHQYPKGRTLFFKADYNHVDADKAVDGILYFDTDKNAWIIHAIYTGGLFEYKGKQNKVKRIKLQKCNGGIIIDGVPYAFERKQEKVEEGLFNNQMLVAPSVADEAQDEVTGKIYPTLSQIQLAFTNTKHLFLSDDDKKVVKKYLSNCEKGVKELEVKINNAKLLL